MSNKVDRILVTGSNGFIGRHLVHQLREDGYDVFTFDIEDGDITEGIPSFPNIQHVYHLAAMTFVPKSWDNPHLFYKTNVMGTINILEFCRTCGCSLTIPSTYMYGNPQYLPIDEAHPMDTDVSPYHNSKYLSENTAQFYAKRLNVKCTILRLFNVYGIGQNEEFLLPHLIKEARSEREQIVVKDLEPKRDYVYIDDVVKALIKSMQETEDCFRVYNVGTGVSLSVREVAESIMRVYGVQKELISLNERRDNEIMDTVADITKISKELMWIPEFSFIEGLQRMKLTANN